MKDYALENAGDTAISINKILLIGLITMLILSTSMGFLLPPLWKIEDINCEIKNSQVKKKGQIEHCMGNFCYTESYLILEDNSTVWVSPATFLMLKEGDVFNWPVC